MSNHHILINGHHLLRGRNMSIPSSSCRTHCTGSKHHLICLSATNRLSTVFIIDCLPSRTVASTLRQLAHSQIVLLVHSYSRGVATRDLYRSFSLSRFCMRILPTITKQLCARLARKRDRSTPTRLTSGNRVLNATRTLSSYHGLSVRYAITLVMRALLTTNNLLLNIL